MYIPHPFKNVYQLSLFCELFPSDVGTAGDKTTTRKERGKTGRKQTEKQIQKHIAM